MWMFCALFTDTLVMAGWRTATLLLFLLEFVFISDASTYLSRQQSRVSSSRLQRDKRNFRPNIILILTDDQDIELGSMLAMNKTKRIMMQGGTHFSNAFSTTPMCCPSRSSILTGKYVHNHHTYTNNENCSSPSWQTHHEPYTFAVHLNNSGYRTAFFGKYLNEYNGSYVPPGWREWVALVKNSRFYNYTLCRNGVREKHGMEYTKKCVCACFSFVTKVHNMLVETGELDNTYLIYMSDHGYHIGQFGLVKGKSMPYEFDIRVPFYIRGPNVEAGAINPHIVLNIDLAPTLLDMAGVDIPVDMDGKSILKLLDIDRPVNRFQFNKKGKVWRESFLVERGKLLHKLSDGKEEMQENSLPRYQQVRELCQKAEYQTPCEQPGQKWQCVEDPSGMLRLHKCKGMAGLYAPHAQGLMASNAQLYQPGPLRQLCDCEPAMPFKGKKMLTKRKLKPKKSLSRNRWARSLPTYLGSNVYALDLEEGYRPITPKNISHTMGRKQTIYRGNEEFSGMEPTDNNLMLPAALRVTYRCSILMNDTVKCDSGLYKSLQAWKDHKLHIEHEIETLQNKIKNLRDVKGHLRKVRPKECECNNRIYHYKNISLLRLKSDQMHSIRLGSKNKKQWLLKEQKRWKKLRKLLKRLRNNDTCSMPGLTCFTHDNQHWQTAPFWTMGPFCACTSANNNTYWCLRTLNDTHNFLFCEFATGFLEYFDLNTDPYQLINAVSTLDRDALNHMHLQLMKLRSCKGQKQCNLETG
ncbi:hypothetical protein NFI96_024012 [Prochilodus magdalenae]|nr:hypothetical protein NFI96_024012 [Prochilodus magdalenae]